MLKALEIENFKAFGDRTRIEMAPITLIYGQNSAGKSSILQALNLLKQTHESRESGAPLLPRAKDGIVDLGSFRELLFDHDAKRVLRLGFEFLPRENPTRSSPWQRSFGLSAPTTLGMEIGFRLDQRTREVGVQQVALSIGGLEPRFATFAPRSMTPSTTDDEGELVDMPTSTRYSFARSRRAPAVECDWVTDDQERWSPIFSAWLARSEDIRNLLDQAEHDPPRRRFLPSVGFLPPNADEKRRWRESCRRASKFYSQPFDLRAFVDRMIAGWRGTQIALDGFLPASNQRASVQPDLPEFSIMESRLGLRAPFSLPSNDVAGLAFQCSTTLAIQLRSLFPMGPFRRPPERWYIFTGSRPDNVGYKGDYLPDLLFRRPGLVNHANRWLERLEIGYRLKVKPVGERDSDLFGVRLVDTRRSGEVEVGLSDVGFGISQILPFVVQSLATTDQLISIEQPEVHIHPKLQADLGELLAEGIASPFRHQYLIETHSEHLVLRIQKLVREGKLKPSDVSVIFVERGPSGSRANRLHLDEQGEFIDEWPGGFFPERLRELM